MHVDVCHFQKTVRQKLKIGDQTVDESQITRGTNKKKSFQISALTVFRGVL